MSDVDLREVNEALKLGSPLILGGVLGLYLYGEVELELIEAASTQEMEELQGLALRVSPGFAGCCLVVLSGELPVYSVRMSRSMNYFCLPDRKRIQGDLIQLVRVELEPE
jgi:hypothetical protein